MTKRSYNKNIYSATFKFHKNEIDLKLVNLVGEYAYYMWLSHHGDEEYPEDYQLEYRTIISRIRSICDDRHFFTQELRENLMTCNTFMAYMFHQPERCRLNHNHISHTLAEILNKYLPWYKKILILLSQSTVRVGEPEHLKSWFYQEHEKEEIEAKRIIYRTCSKAYWNPHTQIGKKIQENRYDELFNSNE